MVIHSFKTIEINILKYDAEELRHKILEKALSHSIKVKPSIHFTALIEDIRYDMIKKAEDENYSFTFMGNNVNFENSDIMFSITVLKDLFKKKDYNEIKILSKNLDILSFYAYGVPWYDVKILPKNGKNDTQAVETNPVKFFPNNGNPFKFTSKRINSLSMVFYHFIMLIAIVGLIILYWNSNSKYKDLSIKYTNKIEFLNEREYKYQFAVRNLTDFFKEFENFNVKYYYSIEIPENLPNIVKIDFNDDISQNNIYSFNYEIIVPKIGAKLITKPGIKSCNNFGRKSAFGFGKRDCPSGCFKSTITTTYTEQPNSTILRVKFLKPQKISYLIFNWIEKGHNWGSIGRVFINGQPVGNTPYDMFGNYPASNMLIDERVFETRLNPDVVTKFIDFQVFDISNESEIFIDNIIVK